ncbi:hypothetical protein [Acetivibrio sp. MSJd-27]|nr:hypothetical protein [Acetivibrio sp. MSJd-27]
MENSEDGAKGASPFSALDGDRRKETEKRRLPVIPKDEESHG